MIKIMDQHDYILLKLFPVNYGIRMIEQYNLSIFRVKDMFPSVLMQNFSILYYFYKNYPHVNISLIFYAVE